VPESKPGCGPHGTAESAGKQRERQDESEVVDPRKDVLEPQQKEGPEVGGRCRGFVAFYCNDMNTRKAFISLVMVDPRDRGLGIGQALVDFVFSVARSRGFHSCQLEVLKVNHPAYKLFRSKGFQPVEDRGEIYLMEAGL